MSEPWERLPGETAKAHAAFEAYRAQPKRDRTLAGAARAVYGPRGVQRTGAVVGRIREWADANDWEARARAWDAHLDEQLRRAEEEEAVEAARRHAREAAAIQRAGLAPTVELLERIAADPRVLSQVPLRDLVAMVRAGGYVHVAAGRFERLSRGLSDGRTEVTGRDGGPIEMTLDDARAALAPILGVDPDKVVDELAERRRRLRRAGRPGEAGEGTAGEGGAT